MPARKLWAVKRIKKALLFLLGALLIIVTVSGGAAMVAVRQAWPQVDGSARLPGLAANVRVVRDRFGVPHIYADTPADLMAAQGYVHAQERFFQMEFWRRIGQGRLSEMLGKATLEQDKFIRTVGWNRAAETDLAAASPDTRRMLDAYSAGVNAYVGPRKANPASLALEFRILGLIGRNFEIEPWKPVHTLGWAKVMAWDLRGDSLENELLNAALIERGGANLLRALRPDHPADMPVVAPRTAVALANTETASAVAEGGAPAALALLNRIEALDNLLGHTESNGSNNWVVAGNRSATGKPLLADDPHLGIQMPSIWFQIGLHCNVVNEQCPYDVVGVSFAGVPGVVIGHNQRIAWGVTNVGPDVQDLFVERQNPANPDEFEFKGRWEKAQVIEERIDVAGDAPVTLRVRVTRHGPILNDVNGNLRDGPPMSLRWVALQPTRLPDSVLALNRAQNFRQFREALLYWDVPAQSFVYADVDGNIGYQMPGLIPIRANGLGDVPSPGWSGDYEWTGFVNFNELPMVYNPREGYIATANNPIIEPGAQPFLGNDFDLGYRARRIVEMLRAKERHGHEDFQRMHADSESGVARDALPIIKATLGDAPRGNATSQSAWRLLLAWDGQSRAGSQGALIWETYWNRLLHEIFDDELGPDLARRAVGMGSASRVALRNMLAQQQDLYWDDKDTPRREPAFEIMDRAWDATVTKLSARFGDDANKWTWGSAHTATFRNQSLGQSGVALIERVFNRGPHPVDGANAAVNANSHGEDMAVRSVPSLRMIADVSDWDKSLIIHTTGQSGHPFHAHYDDMITQWAGGRYNPMLFTPAAIQANRASELTLTP